MSTQEILNAQRDIDHGSFDQELKYANDYRLLVFLDDTGHESFAGDQPYYAIGGCVVMGAHYEWLRAQWKELRKVINGSPDTPLHAADLTYTANNLRCGIAVFPS